MDNTGDFYSLDEGSIPSGGAKFKLNDKRRNMKSNDLTKRILLVVFCALAIALVPLGQIFALNTLFGLTIPYVFKSWICVVIVNATWFYRPLVQKVKIQE